MSQACGISSSQEVIDGVSGELQPSQLNLRSIGLHKNPFASNTQPKFYKVMEICPQVTASLPQNLWAHELGFLPWTNSSCPTF